jgi:benzoyl-CoA reductase/2-hydroxyglutaryl-CoA dehydratase subunit BcrC/BadD/HgdB
MNLERLSEHLRQRPAELLAARDGGRKMVGYLPGGYVPEEIIHAAGAVPLCLCEGGNYRTTEAALSTVPGVICPFARAQIGEMAAKTNPYYTILDLVVAPITCQHLKKVAEVWEYREDVEVFKLGVPHQRGDLEMEYFAERLKALAGRLERLTGREITHQRLEASIALYDRMNGLLNDIGLMRRDPASVVNTKDLVKLHHASFYADPAFMTDELGRLKKELEATGPEERSNRPRFLLTGPNLAHGDTAILELIEAAGGDVVAEEFFEGMRYCRPAITSGGEPTRRLAESCLRDRLPPAFMRSSTRVRLEHTLKLIEDFRISGVIWYELLCCETYDQESYFFFKELGERGIPMLIVESDYSPLDTGSLKTRIGAFMELMQGGPVNG